MLNKKSLAIRLAVGVVLVNLFVYFLVGVAIYKSRQHYERQAALTTQNFAHTLELTISGFFEKMDISLFAIKNEAERELAGGGINDTLLNTYIIREKTVIPIFEEMWVADENGNVRYGTKLVPHQVVNISDREYFQRIRNNPGSGLVISKPVIGRITKTWSILISRRINNSDGSFAGLVLGSLRFADYFDHLFSEINVGRQGIIELRDEELALISQYPKTTGPGGQVGSKMVSTSTRDKVRTYPDFATYNTVFARDGVERTVSYSKISGHPFYITVALGRYEYLSAWRKESAVTLTLLLLFTLLTNYSARTFYSKRIQSLLHKEETRLQLCLEANSEGVWDWNIPGGQAVFSPRYSGMLGYEPDEFPKSYTEWKELVHPDDFDRVHKAHAEHINEGREFCVELRMRKKTGDWCWVLSRGMVVERDAEGNALRMIGTHMDITRRKQDELELVENEKRYRTLFESAPAGILMIGQDGYVRAANSLQASLYGCDSPRELEGMFGPMFIAECDRERATENMKALLGGKELPDREYTAVRRDGSEFLAEVTSVILRGADQEVQGYLCLARDITERRAIEKQLEDRYRFEKLLTAISAQFINISIDRLDAEMKVAQREICECLELDICSLWQFAPEDPSNLELTHLYAPDFLQVPRNMPASESFPWCLDMMMKKEPVILSRIADAPPEAARDQETWRHYGVTSALTFPLFTGDGASFGALGFNTLKEEHDWSEALVNGLQIVSEIFASALNRRSIEKNLLESEARLRDITFSMADWVWEVDEKGVYTFGSEKGSELFGDVVGKTPFAFMPPDEAARVGSLFSEIAAGKAPIRDLENWNIRKDGEVICLLTNGVPILDEKGNLKGYRGVDKDITESKRAAEALKNSERLLAETEKIGKVGGWELNVVTGKQTWTEEVYRIHEVDLTYEPTMEKGVNFYTPVSRPIIEQAVQRAIEHGEPFDLELYIVTAKGNLCGVHVIGKADLEHHRVYGFFQDITVRKLSEAARMESMARFQAIVEAFDGLIYICSPDYRIEFMNQHLIERTGRDAVGELCYRALHDRDSVCDWCVNERVFQGETVRWEVQSPKDQSWYYVVNSPIRHVDGSMSKQAMIMDITKRKRAEEDLRASEERFRQFFKNVPDYCYIISPQGYILNINDAALHLLGYEREELVGKPLAMIYARESISKMEEIFQRWKEEGQLRNEEMVITTKNGEERVVLLNAGTVHGKDGEVLYSTSVQTDITDRKQAEDMLRERESALRYTQEDLQKLAGRLIHAQEEELRRLSRELHDDLTQRLAVIAIDAGKIELDLGKRPETCPEISMKISQMKEQLISVAEDVHAISRQLHPTILDDLGLVRAIESECAAVMRRENIEIIFSKKNVPAEVGNDIALCIYRVLQESLKNVITHSRATNCGLFLEGADNTLSLTVSDNGIGFDPVEVRHKSGLGLSSMRERAQLVQGDFSITSRPGQGTVVHIRVPLKAGCV